MSDEEGVEAPAPAEPAEQLQKAIDRPGANTGVKGVLADYADAKQKMELLQHVQNEVAWLNVAELGTVAATVREQEELERRAREARDNRASSDEEDEEADDAAFLAQYRAKRMQELKVEQTEAIRAAYRPTFGSLVALTADQLSETLDAVSGGRRRSWNCTRF